MRKFLIAAVIMAGLSAGTAQAATKTFYVTEKVDGTSFTAFIRQGEFGICGRNLWMDEADESNVLVRVARRLGLAEKLRAVQGRHRFSPAMA